jgi:CBS domain-containing protein
MVPLSDYPTVAQEATLAEAVVALTRAQENLEPGRYRHRAVLVTDGSGRVVGKLSQIDVLRALEPRLREDGSLDAVTRFGFSADFIETTSEDYGLLKGPIVGICERAAGIKVADAMTTPSSGEFVAADATLGTAIHQLVRGSHQSLLVTRGDEVIGILRLTDLFAAVALIIGGRHD